jgi:hypothetical protein
VRSFAAAANELVPVTVQIQPSEVERVVPNALFATAIGKRLGDKSLHPRYRANSSLARSTQSDGSGKRGPRRPQKTGRLFFLDGCRLKRKKPFPGRNGFAEKSTGG